MIQNCKPSLRIHITLVCVLCSTIDCHDIQAYLALVPLWHLFMLPSRRKIDLIIMPRKYLKKVSEPLVGSENRKKKKNKFYVHKVFFIDLLYAILLYTLKVNHEITFLKKVISVGILHLYFIEGDLCS